MISFTKMHGLGNDYLMLDAMSGAPPEAKLPLLARAMCDRHFGIGADGIIQPPSPWATRTALSSSTMWSA